MAAGLDEAKSASNICRDSVVLCGYCARALFDAPTANRASRQRAGARNSLGALNAVFMFWSFGFIFGGPLF